MRAEQTVNEMAQVVLWRQARALAQRTGVPFVEALEAVTETPAGMQLEELRCAVRIKRRRYATGRQISCLSA
jgi:protein-disulfide isomerase-like protein with CxxC motif